MGDTARLRWTSAARTDPGLVRDRNEDATLDQPAHGLWAVADGMGGHALGELASRTVIDSLRGLNAPHDAPNELLQLDAAVRNRLDDANRRLRIEAGLRDVPVIGSTAVVLLARERECRYLWAGDSRAYLFRGGHLRQLTRDHSQFEEYKALAGRAGGRAIAAPPRNLITRAIGADDVLLLDGGALPAREGDAFLLCSDGLSSTAGEHEIAAVLAVAPDCGQAAERLIELALKHGGHDNISVVVIRAEDWHGGDETIVNPALQP